MYKNHYDDVERVKSSVRLDEADNQNSIWRYVEWIKSSVRWDEADNQNLIFRNSEWMKSNVRWDEAEDQNSIWDNKNEWNLVFVETKQKIKIQYRTLRMNEI